MHHNIVSQIDVNRDFIEKLIMQKIDNFVFKLLIFGAIEKVCCKSRLSVQCK